MLAARVLLAMLLGLSLAAAPAVGAAAGGAADGGGATGSATDDCSSEQPERRSAAPLSNSGGRRAVATVQPSAEAPGANATPGIAALHPSPTTTGDDGETVVVRFPEPTDVDGWRLVDDAGHEAVLPDRTLSGSVAFSPEPTAAESTHANRSVASLDGRLRLADDGDAVALVRANGSVVDRATYDRARDGRRYVRTPDGWRWRHPSATAFEPAVSHPDGATAFVLPDAPEVPVEALRSAERRVLLAGYTLTSDRVVEALLAAGNDGVRVAVLVDGAPVGGTSEAQVAALDRLAEAGVSVTVLAGTPRTYATHHPKYAVVDDRALVLTENWKPAGVGGRSSRGWGVLLRDPALARALADVFEADASAADARSWTEHEQSVEPVPAAPADGSYPRRVEPATLPVDSARLLLAPDNAERELTALLRSANHSIRLQQVSVSGPDDPLLEAALAAARDGVDVRILLSSSRYVEAENRELAEQLQARAEREGLPVTVELVDPDGAFEKSHVKGVLVDRCAVVLGSLNWNPTALRENREVLVVLRGDAVASYYGDAFAADRAAGSPIERPTPVGLLVGLGLAWLALAGVVASRIRWRRLRLGTDD